MQHQGMAKSLRSVPCVQFLLHGNEAEERWRQSAKRKKRSSHKMWDKNNNVWKDAIWSHPHLEHTAFHIGCTGEDFCVHASTWVCLCESACVVLRIAWRSESHCVQASIWFLTRLFLVPYRLSLYGAMAAKTEVLSTEGPFEGKHGRALVEVYSPAHRFGLHGWRLFLKSGFSIKKEKKVWVPNLFFLHFYSYLLEQCVSPVALEIGE